jgi:hypothetical protein
MITVLLSIWVKGSKARPRLIQVFAGTLTLYSAASFLFLCYRAETGFAFDWLILRYHLADAIETAKALGSQYRVLLAMSLVILLLYYRGLVVLFGGAREASTPPGATLPNSPHRPALIGGAVILAGMHFYAENNLVNLILESRETKSEARSLPSIAQGKIHKERFCIRCLHTLTALCDFHIPWA